LKKVVIIGGGVAGLSVAYHLQKRNGSAGVKYRVLEKCDRPGGLCKSEEAGGFLFDYTGHLLHFKTKYFEAISKELLGSNLVKRRRSAWIYSKGVYTPYPFQANLYGLPEKAVVECLYEFCKAYYRTRQNGTATFYDWILNNFGAGIAKHFMVPYNAKLWRTHPKNLNCDWLDRYIPRPDLEMVIKGAIKRGKKTMGYNSTFLYPREGGIESFVKALARRVPNIVVNQEVDKIALNPRQVRTTEGKVYSFDTLVSTIPITELINAMDAVPYPVKQAAKRLKHVSVLNVNFGFKGKGPRMHWIYVPERRFPFYRVGFATNFSRYLGPSGHGSIYTEISYDPEKGIDERSAKQKVANDLIKMGLIKAESDLVVEKTLDIPYAYVLYDQERGASLKRIFEFLEQKNVFSIGRYGGWQYSAIEDAFLEGRGVAGRILDGE